MTREEVAQIVSYCEEHNISYKRRLEELGIAEWKFYDAKRKYAAKDEMAGTGEFLQLVSGGVFQSDPIRPSRIRSGKQTKGRPALPVSIELRTPTGTMMRISGNLTGRELSDIIIASSAYV